MIVHDLLCTDMLHVSGSIKAWQVPHVHDGHAQYAHEDPLPSAQPYSN